MKLGICVVACALGDRQATVKSVKDLPIDHTIYFIDGFMDLRQHLLTFEEDWTLVLYEREFLDSRFNDAFAVMLNEKTISAYSFCCVVKAGSGSFVMESVRLFKKYVSFKKDTLQLSMSDFNVVKILDGWIYEHGTTKDVYRNNRNGGDSKQLNTNT